VAVLVKVVDVALLLLLVLLLLLLGGERRRLNVMGSVSAVGRRLFSSMVLAAGLDRLLTWWRGGLGHLLQFCARQHVFVLFLSFRTTD